MTTKKASSSVPYDSTERHGPIITCLNDNDVLLGRGKGASKFIGNTRFRDLVNTRKEEYSALTANIDKAVIAYEVYYEVQSRGGRFLKLIRAPQPGKSIVKHGVWNEANEEAAIEKCKQSLRQKRAPSNGDGDDEEDSACNENNEEDDEESPALENCEQAPREKPLNGGEEGLSREFNEEKIPVGRSLKRIVTKENVIHSPSPNAGMPEKTAAKNLSELHSSSLNAEMPESVAARSSPEATGQTTLLAPPSAECNVNRGPFTNMVGPGMSPAIPPRMFEGYGLTVVDARILLFQASNLHTMAASRVSGPLMALCYQERQSETHPSEPFAAFDVVRQGYQDNLLRFPYASVPAANQHPRMGPVWNFPSQDGALLTAAYGVTGISQNATSTTGAAVAEPFSSRDSQMAPLASTADRLRRGQPTSDDDVSESFLSVLGLGSDRPRFTEQEEVAERASMTEEEKAAVLVDMFGKTCSITNHQSKRARRDRDGETLSFLLKKMRAEIERIPQENKQALLVALQKCRAEEFSDMRLEKFLYSEGMNPKVNVANVIVFIINET